MSKYLIKSCYLNVFSLALTCFLILGMSACKGKVDQVRGGSCKKDSNCISGWICEDHFCVEGKRSATEIAAQKEAKRKAKEAKRKAKAAKKLQTKSGEGRLHVRICPFFKNTDDSVATLIAVNKKTKKRHLKSLHLEVNKDSMKDLFTFYSLPLGDYEVSAKYGVQVNGVFDTHTLKCDPKNTSRSCEGEVKRIVKVELPQGSLEDDLKKKYPCDWVAE
jgi:hypothetical protein